MKKKLFYAALVIVLGLTIIGCDLPNLQIDPKFMGKWEFKSIVVGGVGHNFPYTFPNGQVMNSGGYEIGVSSVKIYNNGTPETFNGIYSEGNTFFNSAGRPGFVMQINEAGNAATINVNFNIFNCEKVPAFSWE